MHYNEKLIILTGGTSVYDTRWSACDRPMTKYSAYFKKNIKTEYQKEIESKFGKYLLVSGKANNDFEYFFFDGVLILQSRRYWYQKPMEGVFFNSIVKAIIRYHNNQLVIKSPWVESDYLSKDCIREKLISIRHRIESYLENITPKQIGGQEIPIQTANRIKFTF
jgi:hypothetical protein